MTTLPQTILLLGSGELGRELTMSLKRLGCKVVACDSYEGAPAMQVADEFRVFAMTDAEALRAAIDEVRPDLVVPEVEKVAVGVLRDVVADEALAGTRVVPNSAAVLATFDRRAIRELAAEVAGVPTSTYRFASSAEELSAAADAVGYPCFIKPTMSSSGHGQSVAKSPEDIEGAWATAQAGARAATNVVICEGAVNFDYEITLLTVRAIGADGEPEVVFCEPIGHRQVSGDYVESWQPQPMSDAARESAREIAGRVIGALADAAPNEELLGLFGVELFVCGDKVIFSEVSPRPHDTGMVTSVTQRQSEFDLHARAILRLPVDTSLANPGASAVIKAGADIADPVYDGVADALRIADDVRIFRKPEAHPGRRMGVVLAAGPIDEARERAQAAAAKVWVS